MILLEFINHIKHNSLNIVIYDCNDDVVYDGSIGTFKHWVHKDTYSNCGILQILPSQFEKDVLFINLCK